MKVFLSILFILIIGSQNSAYSQSFGVDSSYLIPNKQGYFSERIYKLNDSSFFVGYNNLDKTFKNSPTAIGFSLGQFQAFGIYTIDKEELYFHDFLINENQDHVNYLGLINDNLIFKSGHYLTPFNVKSLTFLSYNPKLDSLPILGINPYTTELYYHDTLNNAILSKHLFNGALKNEFRLDANTERVSIAFTKKTICLVVTGEQFKSTKALFLDYALNPISTRELFLKLELPPYGPLLFKVMPKNTSENFILEVSNYGEGGSYFNCFEIGKAETTKLHTGIKFRSIKQMDNGLSFFGQPWKSTDNQVQIRHDTYDFIQIDTNFYALDKSGVRKLKDGLIYLDLFQPVKRYEYLSKFHVLEYETNSSTPPNFKIEGPGYISNDTEFFNTAGSIKVIGNTTENRSPSQEVTITVNKSSSNFYIRNCDHPIFWNLPSDLPLNKQIEVHNPYHNQLEASIEGGDATYKDGTLIINEFINNAVTLNIRSIENEKFHASEFSDCSYWIAIPGSDDGSGLEVYPNPVNGNTFNIRLVRSERDKTPVLKLFDLNGKAVKFKMFVADPFNYEIYIPKPSQGTYILKNMSSNASQKVIFNQ